MQESEGPRQEMRAGLPDYGRWEAGEAARGLPQSWGSAAAGLLYRRHRRSWFRPRPTLSACRRPSPVSVHRRVTPNFAAVPIARLATIARPVCAWKSSGRLRRDPDAERIKDSRLTDAVSSALCSIHPHPAHVASPSYSRRNRDRPKRRAITTACCVSVKCGGCPAGLAAKALSRLRF